MTESTARAALFELQSSMSPNYTWAVPHKPVSVRIPFPVIDRLEHEAVESFKSLSSRGSEIGGLLFGNAVPGLVTEVTIEEYELISCDYSRGPLYRLAEPDMSRFDRSILQRGTASPLAVVGMFRSHTRKGLSLDAEDIEFFDSRFRDPHHIFLLIRPFATKASTAGIFIREGGIVQGETSFLEFPFRSSMLSSEKPAVEPPEPKPAAPAATIAPPTPVVSKPPSRGQIVPIASRREMAPPTPVMPVEPAIPVNAPVEPAEPVKASTTARTSSPVVSNPAPAAPSAPAPKVEEKVVAPKPEDKAAKPQVEEKTARPKPEEQPVKPQAEVAKPKPEDKSFKSQVDAKGAKPKLEDKSGKPQVDVKVAKPKPEDKTAKPPVEEKITPAKGSSLSITASPVAPEEQPAKSNKLLLIIGSGVAAVVLLLGAYLMLPHRNQPAGSPQDASQLSLRVERTAGEILLTWNRDSDAIRSASHAVLSITDGDQHENVEMDLTQLRNGSISYSAASSDVVFKMEVTGKNNTKTASESVRVLRTLPSPFSPGSTPPAAANAAAGAKPPVNGATPNSPGAPGATGATTPGTTPGNTPPNSANGAPTPGTPNADQAPPEAAPAKPAQALKPFQAPSLSARLHPANPADLPDAPSLGGVQTTSSAPTVTGLNMNSVSTPVAPTKAGAPAPGAPAADKKAAAPGGQLVQAQLVSKKDPEYPKLARETGAKGIVELIATIGVDGKVKAVKVVKGPPMLQKAASDAVLQWKYKPTMLNGVAVEAQTQVMVNFLGGDR